MSEHQSILHWPSEQGDHFDRAQAFTTTPGFNGWTIKDTSSSGTPTYLCVSGGGAKLTLSSTSEAQIVTLYQNDVLAFDLDELQQVEIYAEVAGIDAVTTLVMGMAGAQNDAADSVAANAWFRMEGSASTSLLVAEGDDGTNDNDDKATAETLAATMRRLCIDFANGKSDVRFKVDDGRVASTTTFDMSNYSGNLQPFVQLQKASGAGVPSVTLRRFHIQYAKLFD